MSTYVIGDVQGCFDSLQRLLRTAQVRPHTDRVWLLGDLVGRGPDALGVLRFVLQQRAYVSAVLGNHDLALLAAAHQLITPQASDKLGDALAAPDSEALLSHLRSMPFVHATDEHLLVHAGVLPNWNRNEIVQRAKQAQLAISSPSKAPLYLARFFQVPGAAPPANERDLSIDESLRIFTCVRTLDSNATPFQAFKGELASMPPGLVPWFRWPQPAWSSLRFCCGHWSALGLHQEGHVTLLDGGCVWGRTLCAMRLDDGALFEVPHAESHE